MTHWTNGFGLVMFIAHENESLGTDEMLHSNEVLICFKG